MTYYSDTPVSPRLLPIALFGAIQIAAVSLIWVWLVEAKSWPEQQQFWGHLGPAIFLAALGAVNIFDRGNAREIARKEAWLAIVAGAAYILVDTFVMHPPLGIFDGAGMAEQEHVAIMGMVLALGISQLVLLRHGSLNRMPAVHFIIGALVGAFVFLNHHQHTQAGTVGHNATVLLLGLACVFRLMNNRIEYAIALIVTAFVFFSSQMGLAHFVDSGSTSPGAWVAAWGMAGFLSATGFLLLASPDSGDEPRP